MTRRVGSPTEPLNTLRARGRRPTSYLFRKFTISDGCWEWTGAFRRNGYGRYGGQPSVLAHRAVYEALVGPIPEGMQLDHLCKNRSCVNPAHLEPVTPKENILRGAGFAAQNAQMTHCIHGHEFTEANTYIRANGARTCRTCMREIHWPAHRARQRAKRAMAEVVN
mgnify:FL=1